MEQIPALIAENLLTAAVITGVLGVIVGVLIGAVFDLKLAGPDLIPSWPDVIDIEQSGEPALASRNGTET